MISRRGLVKAPHLLATFIATLVLAVTLIAGNRYAEGVERQYVHGLAPLMFQQKNQGSALQGVAFEFPDLLPLYGSSELNFKDPYDARQFFMNYPTGFSTFPVGTADTEPLIMLQKFAAITPEMRGKKIVISLSPSFYYEGTYHDDTYAANFSPLHANALAFSTELSADVKRGVAERMLEYSDTLKTDPFLGFALQRLVDNSPLSLVLYDLALPLGKLHLLILNLQDHWETVQFISKNADNIVAEVPHIPRKIDWEKTVVLAEDSYKKHANNNPLGMDNAQYDYYRDSVMQGKNSTSDAKFINLVNNSGGWGDLDLLLHGLQDLGAHPLLILIPLNGAWFDWQGISYSARALLYQKLRDAVKAHHTPAVIMDDHDNDKYFLIDPGAHLSSRGWVFYNKVLNDFYHDSLPGNGESISTNGIAPP